MTKLTTQSYKMSKGYNNDKQSQGQKVTTKMIKSNNDKKLQWNNKNM